MKHQFLKGWSIVLVVVLVAAFAVAPARSALADSGGAKYHNFNVTFTKWITTYPDMAGVGGGAIGPAAFTGTLLSMKVVGSMEYAEALYHFSGSKHSFDAHIYATQDDTTHTGGITGSITGGWLRGGSLTGEYKVLAQCNIDTPGNSMGTLCFQGVLHLRRAP